MLHMVSWDGKMTPKCHWNPYMWRCIRAVVKFLNCAVYFPDDNSEKYPGILYPGDMTVYHHVWTTVDPNTKDVQRAAVKARMITGTYMLQEQKAKFYHDQDASCPLCNQESETLEHFLLRCQRLDETRQSHLQQVREAVIFGYTEEIWDRLQTQELYQLILDCTFVGVLPTLPEGRVLESIESSTRRFCFAMHRAREEVLKP